jgi:four helix bundle protein
MDEKTFKERTKRFGVNIIQMTEKLPNTRTADILARQIIRSATSVGANYRAACRAKSTPDMINKLKIVEEESDETVYWLELLKESKSMQDSVIAPLIKETDEITAMTVDPLKLYGRRTAYPSPQS